MKVLLISQSPELIRSVALYFKPGWVETSFISGVQGSQEIETVETESPDLVVIDIERTGTNPLEVIKDIRLFSHVPILTLAGADTTEGINSLEAGADDYVTEPISALDFLARVRTLLRRSGAIPFRPETNDHLVAGHIVINSGTHEVTAHGEHVHLTPTQYDLLCLLVRNAGKTLSHEAIACKLWGESASGPVSLKSFIHQLRAKLSLTGQTLPRIVSERGLGYKLVLPNTPASSFDSPMQASRDSH